MLIKIVTNSCIKYQGKYYTPRDGVFEIDDTLGAALIGSGQAEAESSDEDLSLFNQIPEISTISGSVTKNPKQKKKRYKR